MQRTIDLPEEQVRALERLAADQRRSVDDVVQLAVGDYLGRHQQDWADWQRRFDAFVAGVRAQIPADVTPEEIEAEITAARAAVRADQAAQRSSGGSGPSSR